jgi:hypothetical protein
MGLTIQVVETVTNDVIVNDAGQHLPNHVLRTVVRMTLLVSTPGLVNMDVTGVEQFSIQL